MDKEVIERIRKLLIEADSLLKSNGFSGVTTPGIIKEIIIGDALNHEVHKTKHGSDACDRNDDTIKYEYLTATRKKKPKPDGECQIDRIDDTNLDKISKNTKHYFVWFDADSLEKFMVYELDSSIVLQSAKEKINCGMNKAKEKGNRWTSVHIGWSETEIIKLGGKIKYDNTK
jgi:hypothetical protein